MYPKKFFFSKEPVWIARQLCTTEKIMGFQIWYSPPCRFFLKLRFYWARAKYPTLRNSCVKILLQKMRFWKKPSYPTDQFFQSAGSHKGRSLEINQILSARANYPRLLSFLSLPKVTKGDQLKRARRSVLSIGRKSQRAITWNQSNPKRARKLPAPAQFSQFAGSH